MPGSPETRLTFLFRPPVPGPGGGGVANEHFPAQPAQYTGIIGMQLYDSNGRRKYLTPAERTDFIRAAESVPDRIRTFCCPLAYTGCRISEALAITADRIEIDDGVLIFIFECLKKRRRGIYRAVPVPPSFLETLSLVHDLRTLRSQDDGGGSIRLWPWSRPAGWRYVRDVMLTAGISGFHASSAMPLDPRKNRSWRGCEHDRLKTSSTQIVKKGAHSLNENDHRSFSPPCRVDGICSNPAAPIHDFNCRG